MRECEIAEAEIVSRTLLLSFFFVALFLLFRKVDLGLGLALGCAGSIVNFKLLARNIKRLVGLAPLRIKSFAFKGYLLRYLFTGLVLLLSFKIIGLSFWITALGFLMVKLAIYTKYV